LRGSHGRGPPCHSRQSGNDKKKKKEKNWIPAFAGMTKKDKEKNWIPACAGMTKKDKEKNWIPACAGMTRGEPSRNDKKKELHALHVLHGEFPCSRERLRIKKSEKK